MKLHVIKIEDWVALRQKYTNYVEALSHKFGRGGSEYHSSGVEIIGTKSMQNNIAYKEPRLSGNPEVSRLIRQSLFNIAFRKAI